MQPKRHHYVPRAYLAAFLAGDGLLTAYRKESPATPFRTTPENVALERYYYAFTREDGSRDVDSLEGIFGLAESEWPSLIERIKRNDNSNETTQDLLEFACLQRARVPAVRDSYELMRADGAMHVARVMNRMGALPEAPEDFEAALEGIEVAVDPESSLRAISIALEGMSKKLLPLLGFVVLENRTPFDFITSDNPVIWFTPYKHEQHIKPYEVSPHAPVEFLFPITPRYVLLGHTGLLSGFNRFGLGFDSVDDATRVKRINRMIAKFAYRLIISKDDSVSRLVLNTSSTSPVMHSKAFEHEGGSTIMVYQDFTPLRTKAKWRD
jgi:hypothetical protein